MEKIRNTRHPWPSIHIYIYENQICIPSRGKADGRCISHLCTLHRHPRKIHPHKQIAKKISDPFFKDTWTSEGKSRFTIYQNLFPTKNINIRRWETRRLRLSHLRKKPTFPIYIWERNEMRKIYLHKGRENTRIRIFISKPNDKKDSMGKKLSFFKNHLEWDRPPSTT